MTGTTTVSLRSAGRVQERLVRIQEQLRRVRATQRVLAEQVSYLDEIAVDAETRKLVAETPLADREWRDAKQDLDRHRTQLEDAEREARGLIEERDRLLERLHELESTYRQRGDE